jgi:S1-C subfamily serine protease
MKASILAAGLAAALLSDGIAAAETEKVRTAEARPPISVAGRPGLKVVALRKLVMPKAAAQKVGDLAGGAYCSRQQNLVWDQKMFATLTEAVKQSVFLQLGKAGYPQPRRSDSVFESPQAVKADFDLGASLKGLRISVCEQDDGERMGGVWLRLRWELYSPQQQKVLLDVTTEGSHQSDAPEKISLNAMIGRAGLVAAGNLLADPRFVDIVSGAAQPGQKDAAPSSTIRLKGGRPPAGGLAKNATLIRSAVVTLDSGRSTGSGFFIGREGYLLTNQHVVRDAKFLKVKLATGRELVGEVLQSDARRDVALVKAESIGAEPLAIRTGEPNIGEDVYAIGSPLGEKFSGTLTRGVLSGHRTLDALRFLQSDVAVLPGNSGGPLLDADGRVVGIAVRALDAGRANLNLFIPIHEALEVLGVELDP